MEPDGIFQLIMQMLEQTSQALPAPMRQAAGGAVGAARLAPLFLGEPSETGYRPGVSEAVYNAVEPLSYNTNPAQIADVMRRVSQGDPGAGPSYSVEQGKRPALGASLEDPWKLYLGLSQGENPTLVPSTHKPSRAKDPNAVYYDFSDQEKNLWRRGGVESDTVRRAVEQIERTGEPIRGGQISQAGRESSELGETKKLLPTGPENVMANYTVDMGEDEAGTYLSYYDVWDLPHAVARVARGVGKPFEIYGRIYYDPQTFEPAWGENTRQTNFGHKSPKVATTLPPA